jgi:Zn finger protein HypA/HybF involved in hydrogenase expression
MARKQKIKQEAASSRPCLKCNKNFANTSKFDCVCPQCEVRNESVGGKDCRTRTSYFDD